MAAGRTDSDLDDVWSDESGELERGAELTELEFTPPKKKVPPKKRPPLISDLEAPVLGALPSEASTLEVGSVLVGSSASVLHDPRAEPDHVPAPKDARTIIADAEGAAIARVVSRSMLTGVGPSVSIPPVLEQEGVRKVLMGKREEEVPAEPTPAVEERAPSAPPLEAPLELAFDPRQVRPPSAPQRPAMAPPTRSAPAIRWVVVGLLAIVVIAFVVRLVVSQ